MQPFCTVHSGIDADADVEAAAFEYVPFHSDKRRIYDRYALGSASFHNPHIHTHKRIYCPPVPTRDGVRHTSRKLIIKLIMKMFIVHFGNLFLFTFPHAENWHCPDARADVECSFSILNSFLFLMASWLIRREGKKV